MRVAFLGMGIMGRPMAANLVKVGHEVSIWNRTAGKDLEGARTASSPAEAVRGVEVVWMCVSDTKAVENVLFGPSGAEEALTEGMIIADSSTISPSAAASSSWWAATSPYWQALRRSFKRWANKSSTWATPARVRPPSSP